MTAFLIQPLPIDKHTLAVQTKNVMALFCMPLSTVGCVLRANANIFNE